MKTKDLQEGKEYIFKSDIYSRYPKIEKGLVVEKTKTTIKIKFESGFEKRYELSYFGDEYRILEEIYQNKV
jgi:hypothetical protein